MGETSPVRFPTGPLAIQDHRRDFRGADSWTQFCPHLSKAQTHCGKRTKFGKEASARGRAAQDLCKACVPSYLKLRGAAPNLVDVG